MMHSQFTSDPEASNSGTPDTQLPNLEKAVQAQLRKWKSTNECLMLIDSHSPYFDSQCLILIFLEVQYEYLMKSLLSLDKTVSVPMF